MELYLQNKEGIAICSSVERLRDAITDEKDIYIGEVKYIDFKVDPQTFKTLLDAYGYKRKSFEHEKELRAIYSIDPRHNPNPIENGVAINVDLEILIEKIHVSPGSPSWLVDIVKSAVSKAGYGFEVLKSEMDDSAIY